MRDSQAGRRMICCLRLGLSVWGVFLCMSIILLSLCLKNLWSSHRLSLFGSSALFVGFPRSFNR